MFSCADGSSQVRPKRIRSYVLTVPSENEQFIVLSTSNRCAKEGSVMECVIVYIRLRIREDIVRIGRAVL